MFEALCKFGKYEYNEVMFFGISLCVRFLIFDTKSLFYLIVKSEKICPFGDVAKNFRIPKDCTLNLSNIKIPES